MFSSFLLTYPSLIISSTSMPPHLSFTHLPLPGIPLIPIPSTQHYSQTLHIFSVYLPELDLELLTSGSAAYSLIHEIYLYREIEEL